MVFSSLAWKYGVTDFSMDGEYKKAICMSSIYWFSFLQQGFGPLTCQKCQREMMIISVIDDEDVIKKSPRYLGFMGSKPRPSPKDKTSQQNVHIDYLARFVPKTLMARLEPGTGIEDVLAE
jgi:hypothetical protein